MWQSLSRRSYNVPLFLRLVVASPPLISQSTDHLGLSVLPLLAAFRINVTICKFIKTKTTMLVIKVRYSKTCNIIGITLLIITPYTCRGTRKEKLNTSPFPIGWNFTNPLSFTIFICFVLPHLTQLLSGFPILYPSPRRAWPVLQGLPHCCAMGGKRRTGV